MTTVPLTHHEILELAAPFARRGLRIDLPHSDRLARRLHFTPRDRVEAGVEHETLALDNAMPGRYRLTRALTSASGLRSTLWIDGPDPEALIERIDAVPRARHFVHGAGFVIALDHRLDASGATHLVHGAAGVDGVTISLTMPTHRSRHADIAVSTSLDDAFEPPDDLLAVLGWRWSRLDRRVDRTVRRWTGSVRLAGRGAAMDADAGRRLERAALHLTQTLAEPPARYHDRWRTARWVFAFRRAIPLLVCVALIGAALAFTKAGLSQDSVVRMLIFNAPPLMLVAFFCMRELPRIEMPRRPRRSNATAWRAGVAVR